VVSLKDVARETGLGLGTVSRALSGHPNVKAETRRRVEAAARSLGYQSNGLARALRSNRSNTVGLIIPDLENEFYTTAASVVQEVLAEEGCRLVLCCSDNQPDTDLVLLGSLIESRVDGIAHVPCTAEGSDPIRSLNPHLPIVEYARRSSARNVDSVLGDDERGGALLTRHLIDLGHRSLAMIAGPPGLSTTTDRVAGFVSACRESGIDEGAVHVLYGEAYDARWGARATERILAEHPEVTALFASSSRTALGAMRHLHDRGVVVPRDMSVVGFLNPAWFDICDPPLTTYELPLHEMGDMTARLLLRRIKQQDRPDDEGGPSVIRFQGRLIERGSTAAPGARPRA
jgi:LacI family transcriptional regulator